VERTAEKELKEARRIGRKMGIEPDQLRWQDGKVWYRSLDFGDLNEILIPSADSVTIKKLMAKGTKWGRAYDERLDDRPTVEHTLNAKQIREDMPNYCDGQFVQYLRSGGPCNFDLPFETIEIDSNYPMTENGRKKTEKKFEEELEKNFVGLRHQDMKVYRETKQGAIPKSRDDKQRRARGETDYSCRTISDFSAIGTDGISINEAAGDFLSLDLPQGERIHANIWEVHAFCVKKGLDPRGIRGVKIDIQAAYRTVCTHPADWWALCFRVAGKSAYHKRWPFGLKASVYFFLRLPVLIVTYLVTKSSFERIGARAGMYVDDLMVFAHESFMRTAIKEVMELFIRWLIPRQETKFLEDNKNGEDGDSEMIVLGLLYDLANLTIAIPRPRVVEIMEEMNEFIDRKRTKKLAEWESTTGVVNWVTMAIPQLRAYLTSAWQIIKAIKYRFKRKGKATQAREVKVKLLDDVEHDWKEMIFHMDRWNGKQKILKTEWEEIPEEGYSIKNQTIAPASDASGSWGWGAVCQEGYAFGKWSQREKGLLIHIKEGLGVFALVALFGKELSRKKIKLTLRCDNKGITSALKKGRAKEMDMAIIVRLIMEAMIRAGIMLQIWKTGKQKVARVEYISSKNNALADALSRDGWEDFEKITNNISSFKKTRRKLCGEDEKRWKNAVDKIIENMDMRGTLGKQRRQE
jgi:hypothetical protein